jgi:hypothetical protein
VGHAVKKERYEDWERESDVGKLGKGPIGKETDAPIIALDVGVDWWYEVVAPRWSWEIGWGGGEAEGAVSVELMEEWW